MLRLWTPRQCVSSARSTGHQQCHRGELCRRRTGELINQRGAINAHPKGTNPRKCLGSACLTPVNFLDRASLSRCVLEYFRLGGAWPLSPWPFLHSLILALSDYQRRILNALLQVRVAYIHPAAGRVETHRIAKHHTRAHKLALVPDEPGCFFSCGEDGVVMHCDIRCRDAISARRLLTCRRPRPNVSMFRRYGMGHCPACTCLQLCRTGISFLSGGMICMQASSALQPRLLALDLCVAILQLV